MSIATPQVTLAITPTCPHCPGMLEVLSQLVKKGDIGTLQVVNIATASEFAANNNIRSVPWLKIGPFILQGLHKQHEIQTWLEKSQSAQGIQEYISELLSNGDLASVGQTLQQSPDIIKLLIPLIESDETNINVRLGIGAILEDLAHQPILEQLLDDLLELLNHDNPRVRGDAAHFLSFIKSVRVMEPLKRCLSDPDEDVREIAQESLETLSQFFKQI